MVISTVANLGDEEIEQAIESGVIIESYPNVLQQAYMAASKSVEIDVRQHTTA